MILKDAIRARQKLIERLPLTGGILRGSLVERRVFRHKASCEKCASGEGHPLTVLTVSYPGGRTRQLSVSPGQVDQVRQWLASYQRLKEALEEICEINHHLLRGEKSAGKRAGRKA